MKADGSGEVLPGAQTTGLKVNACIRSLPEQKVYRSVPHEFATQPDRYLRG